MLATHANNSKLYYNVAAEAQASDVTRSLGASY